MADFFISYTQSDRDWAFWLAAELKALGHTPHIHEWEIEGGEDIYGWMETRVDAAHHMLCVVSEEYLKAPYSTLERRAGLWVAAKERPGFVLLVQVKPCRLPRLSANISRCNLVGKPRDTASKQFREFIAQRKPPEAMTDPFRDVYAATNIPIRVPTHFMGRDDALAAIEKGLGRYEGRVAITALHGLRGVGKTTLAAAYAESHRGDYRATWWIRAQSESGMRADLVGLGVRLGWVAADEQEEPALAAVMERLRHEGDGILLIYDNAIDADGLRPYLPKGGAAKVLVTSNAHAWRGLAEPVEIPLWPKGIGADYLVARTGRTEERPAAEDLSEALGGLPLAHEQAAEYCERLALPLAEYHKRFSAEPARLLDIGKDAPIEHHERLTVAKTFALAIEEAAKLHPAAEPLLVHAALLAPGPIPLFLFADARDKFAEPLASGLVDAGLDDAVAALRAIGLVDRESIPDEQDPAISTDTIRLHPLVREIAAGRIAGAAHDAAWRALIEAVSAVYPRDVEDPKSWPRARRLDALTLALVGSDTPLPQGEELPANSLLERFASYRQAVLAYAQARPLFERALAIREKTLGAEHPLTAMSLDNLASLLRERGDLAAARPLCERALTIREKTLGLEHPLTAVSLDNLASLLRERGDLAAARPLCERALAIREKVLGPDHLDTAQSLEHLALLLQRVSAAKSPTNPTPINAPRPKASTPPPRTGDLQSTKREKLATDAEEKPQPANLFICYSSRDKKWREELQPSLLFLQRKGIIKFWYDRMIEAGKNWDEEIQNNLDNAEIVLCLVSRDFLISSYIRQNELPKALDRHESGVARLIPLIVRACNLTGTPFEKLQTATGDFRPLRSRRDRDDAYVRVELGLENAWRDLRGLQRTMK